MSKARRTTNVARRAFLQTLGLGAVSLLAACAPAAPPSPTVAPKPKEPAPTAAPPPAAPAAATAPPAAKPAATAAPAAQPAAKAAGWRPSKPVELILPFNPGGGFDALNRQLAQVLQEPLGQPVVVKNVSGGAQRIAAREFQRAAPDGHTLGYFADSELYASTVVQPADGFDMQSWVWVAGLETRDALVYVSGSSPHKTIADLLAAGRRGDRIRFAHNGIAGYLPMQVIFTKVAGFTNAVMVGGHTGTGDMIPALVRGDIDAQVLSELSSALKFVEAGDLRPLVTLGEQRVPSLKDVPTAKEANLPDLPTLHALNVSYGIVVPPNTPPEVRQSLETAILNAVKTPAFQEWAEKTGKKDQLTPRPGAEMVERKKREYENYARNADELKKHAAA